MRICVTLIMVAMEIQTFTNVCCDQFTVTVFKKLHKKNFVIKLSNKTTREKFQIKNTRG